jgi:hypothetical protein
MERPILFSDAMVQAILAGRKTQTRRLVRSMRTVRGESSAFTTDRNLEPVVVNGTPWLTEGPAEADRIDERGRTLLTSPYGLPGDRLWVREAWAPADRSVFGQSYDCDPPQSIIYRANGVALIHRVGEPPVEACPPQNYTPSDGRWRPSIYMPRWASRLTLEVVSVRVERLQQITPEDILAEGVAGDKWSRLAIERDGLTAGLCAQLQQLWIRLWNSINGDRAPWASNPWVWRVEFRRVSP